MPIFYLFGESPPSNFPLQFWQLFIFTFVIHFTKSKLITRSVPVFKLPEKMHYFLFQKYKSVTKKSSICRRYRHNKSICINNTQLTTSYCHSATNSITNLSNKQLFFPKFKRGDHLKFILPIPTLLQSSLLKNLYTSPFTDVQRITLVSAIYIKGLFSKSMQYYKVD